MKKQNPNNRLVFNKTAVTELNEKQLEAVNGGASTFTILPTIVITFV